MKKKKMFFYILMFLPLLINILALPFLPEKIPAHYDFNNEVTRWGSKYESLLYPIATIFMGIFLLAMAKYVKKTEENGKNNENVLIITGIVLLMYFNGMNLFSLYTSFHKIENLSSVDINMYQLMFGILGFGMLIMGNVMPKLRMNSLIGLRTPWSLKDETTWKKSQRFGGISFIISGIIIILISIFTTDFTCLIWCSVTLGVTTVIDVIYTYCISGKLPTT